MFLILNHQKLDIYQVSREFVIQCYKLAAKFPSSEKFGMVSQIRRAALSVHLNIVEGFSRKSGLERIRYFEIARGSLIEVDAAFDIAIDLNYLEKTATEIIRNNMVRCFKLLCGLIQSKQIRSS